MSKNFGRIEKLSDKGFGFIKVDGIEKGIFFHASNLKGVQFNELKQGDEVVFDGTEPTDKGQKAVGVRIVL